MKQKTLQKLPRRTRLNLEKATNEQVFNELSRLMINNRNRNSATRAEIARYFDCSFNKATRIVNQFIMDGKITRDAQVDNLFWLVVE